MEKIIKLPTTAYSVETLIKLWNESTTGKEAIEYLK
jgi:hypothetical protein